MHDATKRPVNDRLVDAAFELFAKRGYDHTTVDDIAERATVSRTTFFRYYRSKDDVIFPAHDELIAAVQQRLATSSDSTAIVAVADAVRVVLMAAAVVAAHNHVLRRWLRGDATEPVAEIDQAMTQVVDLFSPAVNAG